MSNPTYLMLTEDCLDVMSTMGKEKSVDAIITDPPYESSVHQNQVRIMKNRDGSISDAKTERFEIAFDPLTPELRIHLAKEFVRISRGWIILFCQNEAIGDWKRALEYAGGIYKRAAIWVKPNAQPQMSGDRPANGFESIVCAYSNPGRSVWNGGGKVGIYHSLHDRDRFHPTQKPISLMEQLVLDFTNPGDLIFDPFAGSGSTGVAAKKWARQFIGVEKMEDYSAKAMGRIASTDPVIDQSVLGFTKPKQIPLIPLYAVSSTSRGQGAPPEGDARSS